MKSIMWSTGPTSTFGVTTTASSPEEAAWMGAETTTSSYLVSPAEFL